LALLTLSSVLSLVNDFSPNFRKSQKCLPNRSHPCMCVWQLQFWIFIAKCSDCKNGRGGVMGGKTSLG